MMAMRKIVSLCKKAGLSEERTRLVVDSGLSYRQKVIGLLGFVEGLDEEQVKSYFKKEIPWFKMYCTEASMVRGVKGVEVSATVDQDLVFDTIEGVLS